MNCTPSNIKRYTNNSTRLDEQVSILNWGLFGVKLCFLIIKSSILVFNTKD